MAELLGWLLIGLGIGFFLTGVVALLRFPDLFTRLHALTKADNLGIGLVVAGLSLHSASLLVTGRLVAIWILVMVASASVSHLIARAALATDEAQGGRE